MNEILFSFHFILWTFFILHIWFVASHTQMPTFNICMDLTNQIIMCSPNCFKLILIQRYFTCRRKKRYKQTWMELKTGMYFRSREYIFEYFQSQYCKNCLICQYAFHLQKFELIWMLLFLCFSAICICICICTFLLN